MNHSGSPVIRVSLLTGGDDRSYALGLTASLVAHGVDVDFIGSDYVDAPELHDTPRITFLNLRGDQTNTASLPTKILRLLKYYARLLIYAAVAEPRIFHILWNNKFEWFDRTLLLLYYRLLGRKLVFTAHNVNAAKRDNCDTAFNRFTLGIQYRLVDHIFVHSDKVRKELVSEFSVSEGKVSVIPFGINNTTPTTNMSAEQARRHLGLHSEDNVALFFGQIAPYKGLEFLVAALPDLVRANDRFRLIIAGKVKQGWGDYWSQIEPKLNAPELKGRVVQHIGHVPLEEVEIYFKAADVLVIPYVNIFQSGVPFLGYSFGLPVVATDVGALKEDIVDGETGFVCKPNDPTDFSRVLNRFWSSPLAQQGAATRAKIREFANERHSWMRVGEITEAVYRKLIAD